MSDIDRNDPLWVEMRAEHYGLLNKTIDALYLIATRARDEAVNLEVAIESKMNLVVVCNLKEEIAQLKSDLARYKADAERFEWWEKAERCEAKHFLTRYQDHVKLYRFQANDAVCVGEYDDHRQAIDAARAAEQERK